MRITFRNSSSHGSWDIMSQNDIMEGEGCGWAMWEVGDGKRTGNATVFVEKDEVR
jgi:hypothetical protein